MGAHTVNRFYTKLGLPVYTLVTTEEYGYWTAGEVYDIRVDANRYGKRGENEDKIVYLHEAMCLGSATLGEFDDIPPELVAFITETDSWSEAEERLAKYIESNHPLVMGVFLRLDLAKEFVLNGLDAIPDTDDPREAASPAEFVVEGDIQAAQARKMMEEAEEETYKEY